jgi:selenocysteine-specific elongation factor
VDEIIKIGLQAGELVSLGEGVFYTPSQIGVLKEKVRVASGGKPFAAAAVRDALGTTRKYVIPLLEFFDSIRFTVRVGDNRVIQGSEGPRV